jgi:hypothetical protein
LADTIIYNIECDDLVAEILAASESIDLDDLVAEILAASESIDLDDLVAKIEAHPTPLYDLSLDALVDEIAAIPLRPRSKNATSKFLDKRIMATGGLRGSFMTILRSAVISKLPVSNAVGMVEDHIQNCFERLIRRDSLRERLAAGHPITDQQIAMFAVRAGYTDIRDSGTDPVAREMVGARTEREREKGVVTHPITDPRVVWASPESGEAPGTWIDIADTAANQEDEMQFAQIWSRMEDTIRKHKPNAADRYIGILRAKVDGNTVGDIADGEDVSNFRATSMMAEIRRVLRMEGMDDLAGLEG